MKKIVILVFIINFSYNYNLFSSEPSLIKRPLILKDEIFNIHKTIRLPPADIVMEKMNRVKHFDLKKFKETPFFNLELKEESPYRIYFLLNLFLLEYARLINRENPPSIKHLRIPLLSILIPESDLLVAVLIKNHFND